MKFFINETEIEFNEKTRELIVGKQIIKPSIRTYGDMKALYPNADNINENEGLYFMYRGVFLNESDKILFEKNKLRYDVTIIKPEIIGNEFNKTFGHYHPKNSNGKKFEEIYEVLSGSALFLQQNENEVNFTDAFYGDKVIMKESFGHITINPSDEEYLVMANIVDDTFSSEYNEYKDLNGGNYYYKTTGFEKNPNYKNKLEINEIEDFYDGDDMYKEFLNNQEQFNFLH